MNFARRTLSWWLLLGALWMAALPVAHAETRHFTIETHRSRGVFVSDAVIDTMTGQTRAMQGSVQVDFDHLQATRGTVQFPVKSLHTGLDLRDEHMQGESWLDAKKYPVIRFEITKVEGPTSLAPGQTVQVQVEGRITIHGVTRPVKAKLKVTRSGPGSNPERLRVRGQFKIKLTDFGISVPLPVRLKVANEILVKVDLSARAADAAGAHGAGGGEANP